MKAVIYDKERDSGDSDMTALLQGQSWCDITLEHVPSAFFYRQQTYIQAHSTDSVKKRQTGGTHDQQSLNILSDPRGARWPPRSFSLFTKMAVACLETKRPTRRLCSLLVALFTHHWSSSWTRFRDEAHLQYKNIVQQFSCHSKHSYLSFNGPVTSVAIRKKKTPKFTKILLQKFPSTPVLCQYDLLNV